MNYLSKSSINNFFETLEDIKNEQFNLYLSGIIISDNRDIIKSCPKKFLIIEINENIKKDSFLDVLRDAFSKNKWICFDIKTNKIPNFVEEQFLRIKRENEIFIQSEDMKNFFNEKQQKMIRFFAIMTPENYEKSNINLANSFSVFFRD